MGGLQDGESVSGQKLIHGPVATERREVIAWPVSVGEEDDGERVALRGKRNSELKIDCTLRGVQVHWRERSEGRARARGDLGSRGDSSADSLGYAKSLHGGWRW